MSLIKTYERNIKRISKLKNDEISTAKIYQTRAIIIDTARIIRSIS